VQDVRLIKKERKMDSLTKVVFGFIIGVSVGTLLGVLYAPHKGDVTRRKIVRAGTDLTDDLKDKFSDSVDDLKDAYNASKKDAKNWVKKVKN
jgi:gas vesicle protein